MVLLIKALIEGSVKVLKFKIKFLAQATMTHSLAQPSKLFKLKVRHFYFQGGIMSKRFLDTELFAKEWFTNLSCKHKCLFMFILLNCDSAGIYEPNYPILTAYIGESITEKDILILNSQKKQLEKLENGKFIILDFIKFQQGKFNLNPENPLHKNILKSIEKNNISLDFLEQKNKELRSTLQGTTEVLRSTTININSNINSNIKSKVVKGLLGENEFEAIVYSSPFKEIALKFFEYRKEIKKPFKSNMAIKGWLAKLENLSNGSVEVAEKIVNQTISNQWEGIFPLKDNFKTKTDFKTGGHLQKEAEERALQKIRELEAAL